MEKTKETNVKLLDIQEVLAIIPMSKAGLYLACTRGDIPSVKIGRRVFIPSWWVEKVTKGA